MPHIHGLRNHCSWNHGLRTFTLTGCVLGLFLLSSATAWAGYSPRNPSKPKTPTGSWGSRGCDAALTDKAPQVPFTLLAPRESIGVTISTHPTLVWFVPEQNPFPVELTLFEYSAERGRGNRIRTFELPSTPGLMSFTLPLDQPGLGVGKAYVWQVALICSRPRPSRNPWMEAVIQVNPLPGELSAALVKTTDGLERSRLYAQAGFWYEALAETLKSSSARPFRQQLLADLAQLESGDYKARLEAVRAIAP